MNLKNTLSLLLLLGCVIPAQAGSLELNNTFAKLEAGKPIQVVVIGNSVTYGAAAGKERTISFYWALKDWLLERYPKAEIRLQVSIIFAIGPELQLFRQEEKLFQYKPDLVLAEFGASNGAWGPAGRAVTDPATEGYLRRLRERMPECDVILQSALFESMMEWHRRGEVPPTAAFISALGTHYQCLMSDAQLALAEKLLAGTPWKELMNDGIHPSVKGYEVHSAVLRSALDKAWAAYQNEPGPIRAHPLPEKTLDPHPWTMPKLVPAASATDIVGFQPATFGRFQGIAAAGTGASLTFRPERGRCVGLLLRCPAEMGTLQLKVNDKWVELGIKSEPHAIEEDDPDRNTLLRHFFLADGLPLAWEELTLRTGETTTPKATIEIISFLVVENFGGK